ncbi:MAG: hypothetical protein EHM28_03125 [Spirochaetaceae bacterium]|nr:MAG: hypothetical protein EHM28_03125 [Spirochaetaceae bacterium]
MRKPVVLSGAWIPAVSCIIFLFAVTGNMVAQEFSKEEFARKSREQLVLQEDLYARVTVRSHDAVIAEYALFRRDKTSSGLLLQRLPSFMKGHAWLFVSDVLVFYNPDCSCFENIDIKALPAADFILRELIPAISAYVREPSGKISQAVVTGSAQNNGAVRVLEIAEANGKTVRISVDEKTLLPLQAEYLNASPETNVTATYLSYGNYNKKYLPMEIRIVNAGQEYEISLTDISFQPISNAVFTRAFCAEISR